MIAVLGTGLGLVLALAGAWAIVQALADEGITQVVVPGTRIAGDRRLRDRRRRRRRPRPGPASGPPRHPAGCRERVTGTAK